MKKTFFIYGQFTTVLGKFSQNRWIIFNGFAHYLTKLLIPYTDFSQTVLSMKTRLLLLLFVLTGAFTRIQAQEEAKIMFLTFKISKVKNGDDFQIQLLDKKIVDGKIKNEKVHSHTPEKLVFSILDAQQQLTKSLEIDNPLSSSIESFEPDGTIHRHVATQESSEFMVRFQYVSQMKKLTLQPQNKRARVQTFSTFSMDL